MAMLIKNASAAQFFYAKLPNRRIVSLKLFKIIFINVFVNQAYLEFAIEILAGLNLYRRPLRRIAI